MNPTLTKYFQWCLHNVAHVLACIIILRQCLTLKGLQGTAPVPTSCPCCFVLSCVYMWSRSLFFLSTLVCNVLPRRLFHGSPKAHCQQSISVTILTSTAWRALGLFGAFPTRVRGGELPRATWSRPNPEAFFFPQTCGRRKSAVLDCHKSKKTRLLPQVGKSGKNGKLKILTKSGRDHVAHGSPSPPRARGGSPLIPGRYVSW